MQELAFKPNLKYIKIAKKAEKKLKAKEVNLINLKDFLYANLYLGNYEHLLKKLPKKMPEPTTKEEVIAYYFIKGLYERDISIHKKKDKDLYVSPLEFLEKKSRYKKALTYLSIAFGMAETTGFMKAETARELALSLVEYWASLESEMDYLGPFYFGDRPFYSVDKLPTNLFRMALQAIEDPQEKAETLLHLSQKLISYSRGSPFGLLELNLPSFASENRFDNTHITLSQEIVIEEEDIKEGKSIVEKLSYIIFEELEKIEDEYIRAPAYLSFLTLAVYHTLSARLYRHAKDALDLYERYGLCPINMPFILFILWAQALIFKGYEDAKKYADKISQEVGTSLRVSGLYDIFVARILWSFLRMPYKSEGAKETEIYLEKLAELLKHVAQELKEVSHCNIFELLADVYQETENKEKVFELVRAIEPKIKRKDLERRNFKKYCVKEV